MLQRHWAATFCTCPTVLLTPLQVSSFKQQQEGTGVRGEESCATPKLTQLEQGVVRGSFWLSLSLAPPSLSLGRLSHQFEDGKAGLPKLRLESMQAASGCHKILCCCLVSPPPPKKKSRREPLPVQGAPRSPALPRRPTECPLPESNSLQPPNLFPRPDSPCNLTPQEEKENASHISSSPASTARQALGALPAPLIWVPPRSP